MVETKKIKFITAYGSKRKVKFNTIGPSMVDPQYQHDNDVNTFVSKYIKSGELPQFNKKPHYGDFSHVVDYQDALNKVIQAKDNFMLLPSNIREKFSNSPNKFLNFANDPDNFDEMVKLGLARPKRAVPPEVADMPPQGSPTPKKSDDPAVAAHDTA